ncbi:MAG: TetR family transcriptional regulator C-terminal domain-containing protein [Chryseotalea sp.]
MEKVKKAKTKATGSTRTQIQEAYINFVLTEGKDPVSVYKFCVDNQWTEAEFYEHFSSIETIASSIWEDWLTTTITQLKADEQFSSFTVREKLLTFYFAFGEKLKLHRSYALLTIKQNMGTPPRMATSNKAKKVFTNWLTEIIADGIVRDEIAKRPILDKRYPDLFWAHFLFFLQFWKKDDSKNFERTDVFTEKSVNLAFDLISKGAVDSAFDFAKFIFQQNKFS